MIENKFLHSDSCICYENILFFVTNCGSVLLALDLKTKNFLSDFLINLSERIESLLLYKNYILAFSVNGKKLHIIDVKMHKHNVVYIGCHSRDWGNYKCKSITGDKLVIVPIKGERIIEVDLKTFFVKEEKLDIGNNSYNTSISFGTEIVFLSDENNKICIYNVKSKLYKYQKFNLKKNGVILRVQTYQDDILILDNNGYLYQMSTEKEELEVIGQVDKEIAEDTNVFVMVKKKIYLLPKYGEHIFIFDIEQDKLHQYNEYPENFKMSCPATWAKYTPCFNDDRYFYFSNRCTDFFLLIDRCDGCVHWIKPEEFSYETWIRCVALNPHLYTEEGEMSLNEYLDYAQYK